MKLSFFVKVLGLLILGLVVVYVIDPLDPTTVSTPFLLGIVLMGLSLRQSAPLVAATSLIYCFLTTLALINAQHYFSVHIHASPHPYFWLFQRLGSFLVICALTIYLAHYRTDTQRTIAHVQNILAKLPAPVVISDAAGYIIYANEALRTAFKQEAENLQGKRYVDYLMTDIQGGKAMRYYIELFGEQTDSVHDLEMKPFDSETKISARLTCLGTGTNRVMVTVFNVAAPKF